MGIFDECKMEFGAETPVEIAEIFPWKPRPSAMSVQSFKLSQCLLPKFMNICGIKSKSFYYEEIYLNSTNKNLL